MREAAERLANGTADLSLEQTLTLLFQSATVDEEDAQGNIQDKLRVDLEAHLKDRTVVADFRALAAILWTPINATWETWLREQFASTIASAAFSAIASLCPEIDLALATTAYRSAYGARESHERLSQLRQTLAAQGYVTFHPFIVALATRRPTRLAG